MDSIVVAAAICRTLPLFETIARRAATTARRHSDLGFAAEDHEAPVRRVDVRDRYRTHRDSPLQPL